MTRRDLSAVFAFSALTLDFLFAQTLDLLPWYLTVAIGCQMLLWVTCLVWVFVDGVKQ